MMQAEEGCSIVADTTARIEPSDSTAGQFRSCVGGQRAHGTFINPMDTDSILSDWIGDDVAPKHDEPCQGRSWLLVNVATVTYYYHYEPLEVHVPRTIRFTSGATRLVWLKRCFGSALILVNCFRFTPPAKNWEGAREEYGY
jgi:hypothetical protein